MNRRRPLLALLALALFGCGPSVDDGQRTHPGPFVALALGGYDTCVLGPAGAPACWGEYADRRGAAPAGPFRALAAAGPCAYALDAAGALTPWGAADCFAPPGPFTDLVAVNEACGLRPGGELLCWSVRPSSYRRCTPVPGGGQRCEERGTLAPRAASPQPGVLFRKVALGHAHACGIRLDGTLACWGGCTSDRLRNSTCPGRAPPPAGTFTDVAAGLDFSCAIAVGGKVSCWSDVPVPEMQPPAGLVAKSLAARDEHACAIDAAGAVRCWGAPFDWLRRVFTPPPGAFDAIAVGHSHACARRADGAVACWGSNQQGQITGRPPPLRN